jgi:hypothetical protein
LRAINRQTGNNLLVTAAVCFGLYAIKETIITDHTPFYMLIAPEERVTFGELMDQTFPFFQNLTTHWDVVKAAEEEMSPKMKTFHCMRVFTVAMAKYILRSCKGKGVQERRENLLTEVLKSATPIHRMVCESCDKPSKTASSRRKRCWTNMPLRFLAENPWDAILSNY